MTPVLIVEDEDLMAQTIGRWLGSCGYPLTYATNAESAVDAMRASSAGVAVVDVGLPGEHDGLWLVDEFRRDYPGTALVLATGRDYLPPSATMRTGVVSYLLKPFGRDQLRAAVADAVRWHEDSTTGQDAGFVLESEARARRLVLQERLSHLCVKDATDAARALESIGDDPAERERSARVASTADAIAGRFTMSDAERTALHWAGGFHLLCRLTTPKKILLKREALSHAEFDIVRRGPSDVFELLQPQPFLKPAAALLRSIREREDGLGKPDGLVGLAIPLGSRILAVAEAIEAITHDQPHRPARAPADAVIELLRCAGTQFDAEVVHRAVALLAKGR